MNNKVTAKLYTSCKLYRLPKLPHPRLVPCPRQFQVPALWVHRISNRWLAVYSEPKRMKWERCCRRWSTQPQPDTKQLPRCEFSDSSADNTLLTFTISQINKIISHNLFFLAWITITKNLNCSLTLGNDDSEHVKERPMKLRKIFLNRLVSLCCIIRTIAIA